ncbi:MAG: FCD domain-containing protein [Treponema sp.]|jgi:DNA-binding GntR family transcriptional regulator|nr:FCD domain-containing protein [Treponema sp.]
MLDQLVVQQSYEIREALEGLSARLAAINSSQSNVDDLIDINGKFKNTVDDKAVEVALELDIAFHYKISAMSNNKKLQELIKNYFFTNLFSNTGASNIFIEKGDRTYNGHQAIIHAIGNHDSIQAEKIMQDQIRQGVNMVLSVLYERQ